MNVWFFNSACDGCSNFLTVADSIMRLPSIHLDAIRTERVFLKSERRNIFVESRDFRNAR